MLHSGQELIDKLVKYPSLLEKFFGALVTIKNTGAIGSQVMYSYRPPHMAGKIRMTSSNCYIVTYADSHLHTCTYICRINHNDTMITTHWQRQTQDKRRMEEDAGRLLYKYILPLTLFQGFERVVQGLHVRGSWRPNIKCKILTPLLLSPRCVFLVLLMLGPLHRGFRGPPRSGVAFPTTSGL